MVELEFEPAILCSESVLLITIFCCLLNSHYFDICSETMLLFGPLSWKQRFQYRIYLMIHLCINDKGKAQPGEMGTFTLGKKFF